MARKRKRNAPEINTGSMADIAFLLLIFFLVTTTMNIDKGLLITLPRWDPEHQQIDKIHKRNTFEVLLNARDDLLIEEKWAKVEDIREQANVFIDHHGSDPPSSDSPQVAVVSFKNDRGTSYDLYIRVWNELKAAYNELRNEKSMLDYGKTFANLSAEKKKIIREEYPMRISEAEPEDVTGLAGTE